MRRPALVALGLVAAASSTLPLAGATGAAATGLWWVGEPSDGAVAPPGVTVPPGGLWVDSAPAGDSTVAALRFDVPAGQRAERLVLHVASDSSSAPNLPVDACPASIEWAPPHASPGAYSDPKPSPDCAAAQYPGHRVGSVITIDLSALVAGSGVDLVLVRPKGDSADVVDETFKAPVGADLVTSAPQPVVLPPGPATGGPAVATAASAPQPAPTTAPTDAVPAPAGGVGTAGGGAPLAVGFGGSPAAAAPTVAMSAPTAVTAAPVPPAVDPAAVAVGGSTPAAQSAGRPVAAVSTAGVTAGRGAFWFALASAGLLLLSIATIVSRSLTTGTALTSGRYTIYRGSRPLPGGTN